MSSSVAPNFSALLDHTFKAKPISGMNDGFLSSLASSFSMIMVSEIGDKTFLIAAIMSMTHGKWTVFGGAISALISMTVFSTVFGVVFPHLFSRTLTSWIAAGLLALFGVKMVREGWKMADNQLESEYVQVAQELETDPSMSSLTAKMSNMEAAISVQGKQALFWRVASLTFVAEWGDRSQIATIALAAAQNSLGVTLGAIFGHALCTLLAVFFGSLLAKTVSIRTITIIGGFIFIIFSVFTLIGII